MVRPVITLKSQNVPLNELVELDVLAESPPNLGLVVTGASDHHGTGKVNHDLGCNTTHPDQFALLFESA